jgi:hypothetical protein
LVEFQKVWMKCLYHVTGKLGYRLVIVIYLLANGWFDFAPRRGQVTEPGLTPDRHRTQAAWAG